MNKELCNKENIYTAINLDALHNAAKVLDGDAFKMWIYFSKNQNGYEFELSSKHAEDTFSLSKRRYDNAIKELTSPIFYGWVCGLGGKAIIEDSGEEDSVAKKYLDYLEKVKSKQQKIVE